MVKVLFAWDQIVGKLLQFEGCGLNQVLGKSQENTYDLKRTKVLCGWDRIVREFLQFERCGLNQGVGKYLRMI